MLTFVAPADPRHHLFPKASPGAAAVRARLTAGSIIRAPGCFDALSARVIEDAGFELGFLGGFSLAASRLGLPDVGLLSYGEMVDQARQVCAATSLPIIGDADTGYGNAVNVERTVLGGARAGLAGVMIEDQRWPKRCGHTDGKEVVGRREAVQRIEAAVRAREDHGLDVLIMARTDANATDGFDEALWRAEAFHAVGADLTFLEAPRSTAEMRRYCDVVPGWKTANLVEDGRTPWLSPAELEEIGYSLVIYPVSMLLDTIAAMRRAAARMEAGDDSTAMRVTFDEARAFLKWPEYEDRLARFEEDES